VRDVALVVLGKTFGVRCEPDEWADFLEVLWSPSLEVHSAAEDVPIEIEEENDGWKLRCGEHLQVSRDPWILAGAIRNFVSAHALRRAEGIIALHAATACRDGSCLLIAGPSEAGKTTLLLDLLQTGWSAAGDDLAVVLSDRKQVRTFAKPVQVRDLERWKVLSARWSPPDWCPPPTTTALVPPSAVGMSGGTYRPTLIIFPRFDPRAKPKVELLSDGMAAALCAANCQNQGGADEEALRVFAKLAKGTLSARLTYATSAEALSLIGRLLTPGLIENQI